mmetsp:Transcript_13506/g.31592  ORF Transcript_13506/g.31592 Transcript_13506/m.31592 type:complete len:95 (-) Transcript_13506:773-1057(-)
MARLGAAWATTSSSGSLVAPIPSSPGSHPLQHYLLATQHKTKQQKATQHKATQGNTRQHKATQHNNSQHNKRQHNNSQLDSAAAAAAATTTHPD